MVKPVFSFCLSGWRPRNLRQVIGKYRGCRVLDALAALLATGVLAQQDKPTSHPQVEKDPAPAGQPENQANDLFS